MRHLFKGMLLSLLMTLILTMVQARAETKEQKLIEWDAFTRTVATLEKGAAPESWDGGAFISTRAFDQAAETFEGIAVKFNDGVPGFLGVQARLRSFRITTMDAFANGFVTVDLITQSPHLVVSLKAALRVRYRGLETIDKQRGRLLFSFEIVDVQPNFSLWQKIESKFTPQIENLAMHAGSLLTEAINGNDQLSFGIEVPLSSSVLVDVSGQDILEFKKGQGKDEKVIGTITLRKTMKPIAVSRDFLYQSPVFFKGGVWLFINAQEIDANIATPRILQKPSDEQLDAALASLRNRVAAKIQQIKTPQDDFVLWLSSGVGISLANSIARLPTEQRTISINSTSTSGNILSLEGRDDNFGQFGITAQLAGADKASLEIVLDTLTSRWIPKDGLRLSADALANASAIARLNWDGLLIKEAAKSNVQIKGQARVNINGIFRPFLFSALDGTKGISLGADLACTQVLIDASSEQGSIFGAIPVHHARVDAQLSIALFEEKQKAALILNGLPQRFLMAPRASDITDKPKFSIITPAKAIEVAVTPSSVAASDQGFYLGAKFSVKRVDSENFTDMELKRRAEVNAQFSDLRIPGTQNCPPKPPLRLLIKGLDFGPEGEVVTFILAGAKSEEEKLRALQAFVEGRPGEVPEHLRIAVEQQYIQVKASVEAAKKVLADAAKKAEETARAEAERIRKHPLEAANPTAPIRVICGIFGC